MSRFIVFDVETPNRYNNRMSAIGIAVIDWRPYVRFVCMVQMGRRLLPGISHKLNDMCDHYGICLNHHQADSDSRACAEILLRYLDAGADVRQYIRTCSLNK